MSLIKFTPFQSLETIRDQLAREFENVSEFCCSSGNWYLPIEISEDDKNFYVRTMAPGVKTDEISLSIEDGVLEIACELHRPDLKDNEKMHMSDFSYGKFNRAIKIGTNIEPEQINADYNSGILKVTIPKSVKSIKKTIAINLVE